LFGKNRLELVGQLGGQRFVVAYDEGGPLISARTCARLRERLALKKKKKKKKKK
jgi:hypothetical protein